MTPNHNELTTLILRELASLGADLADVGDLFVLPEAQRFGMRFGVSVAVKYPVWVIRGIANGPTTSTTITRLTQSWMASSQEASGC